VAVSCQTCQDKQWFRVSDRALPGSPDFGRLIPCPDCKVAEIEARRQAELVRLSGMENFSQMIFESFMPADGTELANIAAHIYAEKPEGWLVFSGGYGSGKTHLAAAIANTVKSDLYFAVVPDMLDYLRAAIDPARLGEDNSYGERFELIKNVGLLVLDDLGTENQSVWVKQAMFQLINHRYTRRLPTVITTNDFTRSEPRVIDRICDRGLSKLVQISAPSYRLRGRK